MQDVLDVADRVLCDREVRKITFDELDAAGVGKVASPACGQVVHHPHRLAPLHQLLDQVGADESCTAGDKVGRHLQRIAISSQDFSVLSLHSSVLFS